MPKTDPSKPSQKTAQPASDSDAAAAPTQKRVPLRLALLLASPLLLAGAGYGGAMAYGNHVIDQQIERFRVRLPAEGQLYIGHRAPKLFSLGAELRDIRVSWPGGGFQADRIQISGVSNGMIRHAEITAAVGVSGRQTDPQRGSWRAERIHAHDIALGSPPGGVAGLPVISTRATASDLTFSSPQLSVRARSTDIFLGEAAVASGPPNQPTEKRRWVDLRFREGELRGPGTPMSPFGDIGLALHGPTPSETREIWLQVNDLRSQPPQDSHLGQLDYKSATMHLNLVSNWDPAQRVASLQWFDLRMPEFMRVRGVGAVEVAEFNGQPDVRLRSAAIAIGDLGYFGRAVTHVATSQRISEREARLGMSLLAMGLVLGEGGSAQRNARGRDAMGAADAVTNFLGRPNLELVLLANPDQPLSFAGLPEQIAGRPARLGTLLGLRIGTRPTEP